MDTEYTVSAQLVILACGFNGPERAIYDALGAETCEGARVRPIMVEGTHKVVRTSAAASELGKAPVYAAGDARNGSTLVVNSLADGLACAKEVVIDLLG